MLCTMTARCREERPSPDLLLKSIDPYSDTRFSTCQATRLLREFESWRGATENTDCRIVLGRVMSVLRAAEGASGEWLEFRGD
jgi:hypothetical protein